MSAAAIEALVILAAKYGPGLVADIVQLFQKQNVTIADVAAVFANVKPYEAYGIPTVAPMATGTALPQITS